MATSTWPHALALSGSARFLLAIEGIVGLSAAVSGIGLAVHGLGIPEEKLDGTAFDSFLVPGLLLSLVVGGSLLAAAWMVWRRLTLAPLASLAAGSVVLGWIVVEAIMIDGGRGLQAAIFLVALCLICLAWRSGPLVPRQGR